MFLDLRLSWNTMHFYNKVGHSSSILKTRIANKLENMLRTKNKIAYDMKRHFWSRENLIIDHLIYCVAILCPYSSNYFKTFAIVSSSRFGYRCRPSRLDPTFDFALKGIFYGSAVYKPCHQRWTLDYSDYEFSILLCNLFPV